MYIRRVNGSWLSKHKNMKDRGVGKKFPLCYHSLPLSIPAPTRMFHTLWIRKRPPRFLTINPYPWSPTRTFHTFLNRMETFTALPHSQPLPLCELNKLNQVLELDGYPSQPVTPVIIMSNFASTTRDGIYTNGLSSQNLSETSVPTWTEWAPRAAASTFWRLYTSML